MRAVLMSVLAIAGLTTLPELGLFIFTYLLSDTSSSDLHFFIYGLAGSMTPWGFVPLNEAGELRHLFSIPLVPLLINAVTQGGMLWLIHRHIMHRADWYLGRIGVPGAARIAHLAELESSAGGPSHTVPQLTAESPRLSKCRRISNIRFSRALTGS